MYGIDKVYIMHAIPHEQNILLGECPQYVTLKVRYYDDAAC